VYWRSIPLITDKTSSEISAKYLLLSNLINHQKKKQPFASKPDNIQDVASVSTFNLFTTLQGY
jgi:hypothetical protein